MLNSGGIKSARPERLRRGAPSAVLYRNQQRIDERKNRNRPLGRTRKRSDPLGALHNLWRAFRPNLSIPVLERAQGIRRRGAVFSQLAVFSASCENMGTPPTPWSSTDPTPFELIPDACRLSDFEPALERHNRHVFAISSLKRVGSVLVLYSEEDQGVGGVNHRRIPCARSWNEVIQSVSEEFRMHPPVRWSGHTGGRVSLRDEARGKGHLRCSIVCYRDDQMCLYRYPATGEKESLDSVTGLRRRSEAGWLATLQPTRLLQKPRRAHRVDEPERVDF